MIPPIISFRTFDTPELFSSAGFSRCAGQLDKPGEHLRL